MLITSQKPSPRLAPFIDSLWYCERPEVLGSTRVLGTEKVLPSGRMQIIFNLAHRQPNSFSAILCGPTTRPSYVDSSAMVRLAGAVFLPGGSQALFQAPASAFRNSVTEIDGLWGSSSTQRICETLSRLAGENVLDQLDELLLSQLQANYSPPPVLHLALPMLAGGMGIGASARQLGVARSTIHRLCSQSVGLGPKEFQSLARFQRALGYLNSTNLEFAEVAMACGFFDQPHMNQTFRELGHLTPGQYRPMPIGHNHVR